MNTALSGSITISRVDELSSARKAVARAASASCSPDRVMDVQLVVSELITNALEHGTDHRATVSFGLRGRSFIVSVDSTSDVERPPAPTKVPNHAPAGRGLTIVENLADEVTIDVDDNGVITVVCAFVVDGTA